MPSAPTVTAGYGAVVVAEAAVPGSGFAYGTGYDYYDGAWQTNGGNHYLVARYSSQGIVHAIWQTNGTIPSPFTASTQFRYYVRRVGGSTSAWSSVSSTVTPSSPRSPIFFHRSIGTSFAWSIAAARGAISVAARLRTEGRSVLLTTNYLDEATALCDRVAILREGEMLQLGTLADLRQREQPGFHVDRAFGALAADSPEVRPLPKGMERADSIGFDLHKWMYMPYEVGCTLVRSEEAHRRTFSLTPDYLANLERGAAGGPRWFNEYGVQLSRGFRALKVWLLIKEHGIAKYGRLIKQNVDQAHHLAELIDRTPELERLAPVPLNIVCFRFNAAGLDDKALNQLNRELLMNLHEQGIAVPTYTLLNDKFAIRVAHTNHRTRREDFDVLVQEVVRLGKALMGDPS